MVIFRPKLFADTSNTVRQSQTGSISPAQAAANQRSQMAMQRTNLVTQRMNQAEGMKQQRLNMTMMRMNQQNNLHMARAKQRQGMQNQRLAVQRQIANQRNLVRQKAIEKLTLQKNLQLFKRPSTIVPPVPMRLIR